MSKILQLPQSVLDMIGRKMKFSGGIFSYKRAEEEFEATIIEARIGSGIIMDIKNRKPKHPTVEFLIKNNSMARSRWTRGFPIREIELKDDDL